MKRTPEENRARRERYAVVMKATGDYKQARRARDLKVERVAKLYPKIRANVKTKTIYIYVPIKIVEKDRPLTKLERQRLAKDKRNTEKRRRTKVARDLNYTPKEAAYLRGVSQKKFDDIINSGGIINKTGRAKRWAKMSGNYKNGKPRRFDRKIVEACENINVEYGYDIDSRFGWAVYYFYYINGGTIEGWSKYVDQDPFVIHAVSYNSVNNFQF